MLHFRVYKYTNICYRPSHFHLGPLSNRAIRTERGIDCGSLAERAPSACPGFDVYTEYARPMLSRTHAGAGARCYDNAEDGKPPDRTNQPLRQVSRFFS